MNALLENMQKNTFHNETDDKRKSHFQIIQADVHLNVRFIMKLIYFRPSVDS